MNRLIAIASSCLICLSLLSVLASTSPAGASDLLDADGPLAATPEPSSSDVKVERQQGGCTLSIAPGDDKYPGVTLTPARGTVWNLQQHEHLTARVTNTSKDPLRINLRVDNKRTAENREAWNCEFVEIQPGKTGTIKVVFGKSWGHKPGYPLDPSRITAVLLFTGKSDARRSLRIESITPGGGSESAQQAQPPAGDGDSPRSLIDLSDPDVLQRVTPSSEQVTLSRVAPGDGGGVKVELRSGEDAWPGIRITPRDAEVWDLSGFTQARASITNTGKYPLSLGFRVDNPPQADTRETWNTEHKTLAPGQTSTIIVKFGHSYGFKPSYPLDPARVNGIVLFSSKLDAAMSFRLNALVAGHEGDADEKAADMRLKPEGGVLLGNDTFRPNKQVEPLGGATAEYRASDHTLTVDLPAPDASVVMTPAEGFWHLGDGNQLAVRIRNTGSRAMAPRLQLVSQSGEISRTAPPIEPGASAKVILPFAPETPWRGEWSNSEQRGQTVDGTGTSFQSDKCYLLSISSAEGSRASFEISHVATEVGIADTPGWLGQRPPVGGEWVLTLNENFDTGSLNTEVWSNEGPNYWDRVSRWSKDNLILKDGAAIMRYEKRYGPHNDDPDTAPRNLTRKVYADYTGGYLETFGKFTQCYGYFEARMKLPTTTGLWPAFWMMPDRGADVPRSERGRTSHSGMEFDVMEHLAVWGPHRYNIAMHWDNYGPEHKTLGTNNVYVAPDGEGYITSGVLWLPGKLVFYANGEEVGRWENPRVSSVPMYMMFTVPSGGWDGNVLDDSQLPDDLVIDYVRVWQRDDLIK